MNTTLLAQRIRTSRLVQIARAPLSAYRNAHVEAHDHVLASYPKSGNTWVRMMVAGLIAKDGCDSFDDLSRYVPEVERLHQQPDAHRLPSGGRIVKTHEPFRKRYRKGVYIVRDCRDVVASYWKHQRRNGKYADGLDSYGTHFLKGRADNYGTWARNVDSWLDAADQWPDRYLVVRYENLLAQPVDSLHTIANFLGIETAEQRVKTAVADNSRTRMREKEDASQTVRYGGEDGLSFVSTGASSPRRTLPDDVAAQLLDRFGNTMRRAGYQT